MKNVLLALSLLLVVTGCTRFSVGKLFSKTGRAHLSSLSSKTNSASVPAVSDIQGTPLSSLQLSPGSDLTVDEDEVVTIDTDADLGQIMVMGTLRCPQGGSFTLKATEIMVHGGSFVCGTADQRYNGHLDINLKRGYTGSMGEAAFAIMGSGTLSLFGADKNFG